jgi:hypothetical protein
MSNKHHPLSFAVPDRELRRACWDMISIVVSVPEADRAAWHRSMERFARLPHDERSSTYPLSRAAGCFLRLADACWKEWPEQTAGPARGTLVSSATVAAGDTSIPGGPAATAGALNE